MLDEATRTAILKLAEEGHGARPIARMLGRSRNAVRRVISSGGAAVPKIERKELAEAHRDAIMELYAACKGNLVRVHEELVKQGATISYQALTAFCRRHELVKPAPEPSGHYDFAPGVEMQHDTSPHDVRFADGIRRVQTASLVLGYSRMLFTQMYTRFTRLQCKLFLTEALKYFDGVCERCVIDNTHVVVLSGTGREMRPVPEMEAFADRFGFVFLAHAKNDPDRKGKIERPFHYIENNFLAGRVFKDFEDLNRSARAWCDEKNAAFKRHLHAKPTELFVAEKPRMKPLPIWIPPAYVLHHRMVSVDGYVRVHTHLYSAPYRLIGRRVEVRETGVGIEIYDGPRRVALHELAHDPRPVRITDPSHRPSREEKAKMPKRPEEEKLRALLPGMDEYIAGLKKRSCGHGTSAFRKLLRLIEEYPRDAVMKALAEASRYRLFDLERVEKMVLRNVKSDFFRIKGDPEEEKP